jgi:hypothetical protein
LPISLNSKPYKTNWHARRQQLQSTMLKTLLIILFLPLACYSQERKLLQHDYNFLVTDGEVKKLHQSNDTLYELQCYIDRPCQLRPSQHYKILSSSNLGDLIILKLECLDTIALTTIPYPETRYSTLAIKGIDNKQLGYLPLVMGLTKKQLDTAQTNVQQLKNKFFFTFYSDAYLNELSALKKITAKNEATKVVEEMKNEKFRPLVESYANSETRDMYAAGLAAELLNRACIDKGFNPVGAGKAINSLMK